MARKEKSTDVVFRRIGGRIVPIRAPGRPARIRAKQTKKQKIGASLFTVSSSLGLLGLTAFAIGSTKDVGIAKSTGAFKKNLDEFTRKKITKLVSQQKFAEAQEILTRSPVFKQLKQRRITSVGLKRFGFLATAFTIPLAVVGSGLSISGAKERARKTRELKKRLQK